MKYFAYGSNMLDERLQSPDRVRGATFQTKGSIRGYKLRFHKRSVDGSGKCNIIKTASAGDVVYGVVFEVPDDQLKALDKAEGLGQGYHHDCNIPVRIPDGTEKPILAYVADSNFIEDTFIPYGWYHRLVIAGAEQHQLPKKYIEDLQAVKFKMDSESSRATKREAETALKAYCGKIHT